MNKELQKIKITMPFIEKEISDFIDLVNSQNPDINLDDEFKTDLLEGNTDFLEVMDRLVINLLLVDSYISGTKESINKLTARKDKLEARRDFIRSLMKRLMDAAGLRNCTVPSATLSISPTAPSVEIVDEGLIPDEFMNIKKTPSKILIGHALKEGKTVLGARMSNGNETLKVRQ